jgi:hypothetical protein
MKFVEIISAIRNNDNVLLLLLRKEIYKRTLITKAIRDTPWLPMIAK